MKSKQDFRLNSRAIIGNWYIIKNGNDLCDNCADQSGILFLYDGSQSLPPFHPNCRCVLENRQNEMEEKIRRVFPTVSRQTLDELLSKKYYQYEDIAIPYDFKDFTFYYDDNGKTVRVNLSDIPALLRLSNGKYILGDRNETYSIYLYQLAKALEELNCLENNNALNLIEKSIQIDELFSRVKFYIADYYAEHESPLSLIQLKAKFLAWHSASRRSELFYSSLTYKDYLVDFGPLLDDAQVELSAFHLEIMKHAKKWEDFNISNSQWKNTNAVIYATTVAIDKVESIVGKPLIPSSDGQMVDYSRNYIQPEKLEYLSHFAPIAKRTPLTPTIFPSCFWQGSCSVNLGAIPLLQIP